MSTFTEPEAMSVSDGENDSDLTDVTIEFSDDHDEGLGTEEFHGPDAQPEDILPTPHSHAMTPTELVNGEIEPSPGQDARREELTDKTTGAIDSTVSTPVKPRPIEVERQSPEHDGIDESNAEHLTVPVAKAEEFAHATDLGRASERTSEDPALPHKATEATTKDHCLIKTAVLAMEVMEAKPTLLQSALRATRKTKSGKPTQQQGDVLMVLDCARPSKTLLLKSGSLRSKIPAFADEHLPTDPPAHTVDGITCLLVLEKINDDIPILVRKELDVPIPENPTAVTDSADPTKKIEKNIKDEPLDDEAAAHTAAQPAVDWVNVYGAFLRIALSGAGNVSVLGLTKDVTAATALPVLESVATIAERYDDLDRLKFAFVHFCTAFQVNNTLWVAIAQEPARWLQLSVKLKNPLVFNEASLHVAGRSMTSTFDEWDPATKEVLLSHAKVMTATRARVDRGLILDISLRLPSERSTKKKKLHDAFSELPGPVDQQNDPVSWLVQSVWRDWLLDHLKIVDILESGEAFESPPKPTLNCEHGAGDECLTIAGFYRTIHLGAEAYSGDAYLPLAKLLGQNMWRDGEFKLPYSAAKIRSAVTSLKAAASEMVKPLLQSRLTYAGKEKLPYLTCADVGKVPWADDEEEIDEDIEMED